MENQNHFNIRALACAKKVEKEEETKLALDKFEELRTLKNKREELDNKNSATKIKVGRHTSLNNNCTLVVFKRGYSASF